MARQALAEVAERERRRASTDELTGLPNRFRLIRQLTRWLSDQADHDTSAAPDSAADARRDPHPEPMAVAEHDADAAVEQHRDKQQRDEQQRDEQQVSQAPSGGGPCGTEAPSDARESSGHDDDGSAIDAVAEEHTDFWSTLADPIAGLISLSVIGYEQLVEVLGRDEATQLELELADRLSSVKDSDDAVCEVGRIGTNQFVLFVCGDRENLDRIGSGLISGSVIGRLRLDRDLAVGVAALPSAPVTAEQLLHRAEAARERSMVTGELGTFDDDDEALLWRRVELQSRLHVAVASGQIYPVFQPQMDLRSGRMIGVEVLARWEDDFFGVVEPAEFISIAAQSPHR